MATRRSSRINKATTFVKPPSKRKKVSGSDRAQRNVGSAAGPINDDNPSRPSSTHLTSTLPDLSDVEAIEKGIVTTDKTEGNKLRKKKVKAVVEPELSDYPLRVDTPWKIGAHVSAAGGVENAILNAASIGANAFALFLKSQRKWTSADLTPESIARFKDRLKRFSYSPRHVLPHGNYLVNLGNPDADKREKSYSCFLDELKRCELLGLPLLNFHPGSTVGSATKEESLAYVAACINRAHKETNKVIAVIECMAGSGNVLGSTFAELASMIEQVEDKTRVGICLDTCHMFAAGYDIRTRSTYESTFEEFDKIVGFKHLCAMHLNDSKATLASNKDRHENIGIGQIGLSSFAYIATDPRLQGIPLILETHDYDEPTTVWKTEIDTLNQLSGLASCKDNPVDWSQSDVDSKLKDLTECVRKAVTTAKTAEEQRKKDKENRKRKKAKTEEEEESDVAE